MCLRYHAIQKIFECSSHAIKLFISQLYNVLVEITQKMWNCPNCQNYEKSKSSESLWNLFYYILSIENIPLLPYLKNSLNDPHAITLFVLQLCTFLYWKHMKLSELSKLLNRLIICNNCMSKLIKHFWYFISL